MKPKFEWYENDMTCGSIFLVRVTFQPPTDEGEGCFMLEEPVLREALTETAIDMGLKEWIKQPLRLRASVDAKAMAEKLYAAVLSRLDFEV